MVWSYITTTNDCEAVGYDNCHNVNGAQGPKGKRGGDGGNAGLPGMECLGLANKSNSNKHVFRHPT